MSVARVLLPNVTRQPLRPRNLAGGSSDPEDLKNPTRTGGGVDAVDVAPETAQSAQGFGPNRRAGRAPRGGQIQATARENQGANCLRVDAGPHQPHSEATSGSDTRPSLRATFRIVTPPRSGPRHARGRDRGRARREAHCCETQNQGVARLTPGTGRPLARDVPEVADARGVGRQHAGEPRRTLGLARRGPRGERAGRAVGDVTFKRSRARAPLRIDGDARASASSRKLRARSSSSAATAASISAATRSEVRTGASRRAAIFGGSSATESIRPAIQARDRRYGALPARASAATNRAIHSMRRLRIG